MVERATEVEGAAMTNDEALKEIREAIMCAAREVTEYTSADQAAIRYGITICTIGKILKRMGYDVGE